MPTVSRNVKLSLEKHRSFEVGPPYPTVYTVGFYFVWVCTPRIVQIAGPLQYVNKKMLFDICLTFNTCITYYVAANNVLSAKWVVEDVRMFI